MLLSERLVIEGGQAHHLKTHDFQPELDRVAELRSAEAFGMGDNRLVASIPIELANQWLVEAGVSWADRDAVNEIFRRKLLDGSFAKLRVWGGTF